MRKKCKRWLAALLTLVLLFTSGISTGMIVHASLLPLEEVQAYLFLNGYTNEDLANISVDTILDMLKDSSGQDIVIADDATSVWQYIKDDADGLEVYHEYTIGENEKMCFFSCPDGASSFQMQLIVGKDGQLNEKNKRYIILVDVSQNYENERLNIELYEKSDNGNSKVEPIHTDYSESTYSMTTSDGETKDVQLLQYGQVLENPVDANIAYLNISSERAKNPNVMAKVYDIQSYRINTQLGSEYCAPITNNILNQDMSLTDAGYSLSNCSGGTYVFVIDYYKKIDDVDVLFDTKVIGVVFAAGYITYSGEMYLEETDRYTDVVNNISHSNDINSVIWTMECELKEDYQVNDEYNFKLDVRGEGAINQSFNGVAEKAVVGHYDSLEEAGTQADIKDQLLTDIGYKADYSGEGVDFTVFFPEGTFSDGDIKRFTVRTIEYQDDFREFTDKPIIGEADPWLRVTGATASNNKVYSAEKGNAYIIENGKSINMDTYYGYGYQTIFIKDNVEDNVDLSTLKPTFEYANDDRVYAVLPDTTTKIDENYIGDFTEENQQFTGVIDGNTRNYWITYKKLNHKGPELYVFGPNEREVILDDYFEYKHDILIANIGNQPLEDISVELVDAENVKLDPYWTVGGDGNNSLAAFSTTSSDKKYGEIPSIGKIRLLSDVSDSENEGEVKGTLIIRAKGQEPVMITLNGKAQKPEIVNEELVSAVQFVPYQQIIATNNIHDWIKTEYCVVEGDDALPEGIKLDKSTGELCGVPKASVGNEEKTYKFTIEAKYTYNDINNNYDSAYVEYELFEPSQKEFTLKVKPNTDENVYNASDGATQDWEDGYKIKTPIGTKKGDYSYELETIEEATIFASNGNFDEFSKSGKLWLNGNALTLGEDYEAKEGSTIITIYSQTFNDDSKVNRNGTNTIAMEFRNNNNELHRTAQNFTIKTDTASDPGTKPEVPSTDTQTDIDKVIALINAIPANINSDAKDEIDAARTAYDSLTSAQKEKVSNYGRLTTAENALAQYEAQQAQIAADKEAANKVVALISALPTEIALKDKESVNSARAAYNMLTASQKEYVTNYSTLQSAENKIVELETASENQSGSSDTTEKDSTEETQTVTFVGVLVNKDGTGLADKLVEIHSTVQTSRTDQNGSFQFNDVEIGAHTIYVKDDNNNVIAQKEFNIVGGSSVTLNGGDITAQNHSTFTLKMQLDNNQLTFVSVEEGNKAPVVEITEEKENEDIYIGEADPVRTGDDNNLYLWLLLLVTSLICLGITVCFTVVKGCVRRKKCLK